MSQSSNHLSQEIAVMADVFADLGERLLHAAREMHDPGTPPPEDLLQELAACRTDLFGLRDRARALAESLNVPCPPLEQLDSLQGLAALLDDVAEAEIRQSKCDELRRRAQSVLQRVLTLAHASGGEFAPLLECQGRARDLLTSMADAPWASLPEHAERLAEGDHAFAHLLTLLEDRDEIEDDHWATLHESISKEFGKALAAAVARSKLVQTADSSATAEDNGFETHGRHAMNAAVSGS